MEKWECLMRRDKPFLPIWSEAAALNQGIPFSWF